MTDNYNPWLEISRGITKAVYGTLSLDELIDTCDSSVTDAGEDVEPGKEINNGVGHE